MPLDRATLQLLIAARGEDAGLTVPAGWPDADDRAFLERRAEQVADDPSWVQRAYALVLHELTGRLLVGHAGFHGPPGVNGREQPDALEIGYTVFPPYQRRGYASEAVEALVAWGRDAHGVTVVLASVAPGNAASQGVLHRTGFAHVGEQMDDVDGLELVYELRVP